MQTASFDTRKSRVDPCLTYGRISWTEVHEKFKPDFLRANIVDDKEPTALDQSWISEPEEDIKVLRLNKRNITDQDIEMLEKRCPSLEYLHIEDATQVTDEGL